MFEKIRIKEHMEVADCKGQHVGTVDEVEGDAITALLMVDVDQVGQRRFDAPLPRARTTSRRSTTTAST